MPVLPDTIAVRIIPVMDALAAATKYILSGSRPLRTRKVSPVPMTKARTNIETAGYFFTNVNIFFLLFLFKIDGCDLSNAK
jgi:hypothetical protein